MKYLVTGNMGFIGAHLEKYLSLVDVDVSTEGVDLLSGYDLNDKDVTSALPDCDIIFHLAATNGTRHFYNKPTEVLFNNTITTLNLIDRYKKSNTKFLFASTCEIFNGATDLGIAAIPTDEAVPIVFQDILNPRWSYSLPKALGENAVANAMENWLIVRYFNIYGPGQKDHFIDEFVRRVKKGEYYINGDDTRSFCYVADAVALTKLAAEKFNNEIINIGSQIEHRISDVARLIMECMGVNPKLLEIRSGLVGSAGRRCPDVRKLTQATSYKYKVSLEKGIECVLEAMK